MALSAFNVFFDRSTGAAVGMETSAVVAAVVEITSTIAAVSSVAFASGTASTGEAGVEEVGNSTMWEEPSQLSSTQIILVELGVICKLLDGCHSTPSLLTTTYL